MAESVDAAITTMWISLKIMFIAEQTCLYKLVDHSLSHQSISGNLKAVERELSWNLTFSEDHKRKYMEEGGMS